MPAMVRPKGKAKKIAFSILGTPPNIAFKRSKKQRRTNRRLVFEETFRVR